MKNLNMTKKKFINKWPSDEWLERVTKGRRKNFRMGGKRYVLVATGNLKKWMSVKYYGHD